MNSNNQNAPGEPVILVVIKFMNLFSLIFFILSWATVIPATIMIFLCRKEGYSFNDLWIHGSFIYRYLPKYVEPKYIKPILILSYIGLSSFFLCVGGMLYDIFQQM